MTISIEKIIEENRRRFRKRHTISAKFNGAQLKVLSDAANKSRCSKSSLIRQAVMEYLCVNHGSIVPPELNFVDEGNKKKVSLRYRKLCRSVMTGEYFIKEGNLYEY